MNSILLAYIISQLLADIPSVMRLITLAIFSLINHHAGLTSVIITHQKYYGDINLDIFSFF
jgi:hypothetical protein